MVVEVTRKAFLASLVPVIVDAILNEHHIVADIVAFVPRSDFPRSRLAEKQRGKILALWVTRKLRTIAQFSIRDPDSTTKQLADMAQYRNSRASKPGSIMGNSTRRNTLMLWDEPRSPASIVNPMAPNDVNQPVPPPLPGTAPPPPPMNLENPPRKDSLQDISKTLDSDLSGKASLTDLSFRFKETPPTDNISEQNGSEIAARTESMRQNSIRQNSVTSQQLARNESRKQTMASQSSTEPDMAREWPLGSSHVSSQS